MSPCVVNEGSLIEGISENRHRSNSHGNPRKCTHFYEINAEICRQFTSIAKTRINVSFVVGAHTEKFFQNPIKSTRNQIVFTIFRLISDQTDVRLVSNPSENGKYNLLSA